ncbi:MAG: indolepyruvate ferredoxin oxidoreductase subunit alpha [Clostridiales Family XIII bacterium]|jgi:indolepyruvate ferredoxin oxidoreductase alpha subunit|nr:indolepyruvate ferredoxin oxidoreductase subunit alpha [Clostridiales Family XIII bacterium]
MSVILSGNEAVARGAYEAGLVFASAYPGTPSTEVLENLAQYKDSLYCEWAPNEKVAMEAAIGASIAGVRSLAAMKHVGVNVAADPLFTIAYMGATGGLVLVSADDPGQHSSQNEQDNRNYAEAARLLMLNPSDSQESKDFTKLAFDLSEKFNTPVLLHITTRTCHSKGIVTFADRVEKAAIPYEKNSAKYVSVPANAKVLRAKLEDRVKIMEEYANTCEINKPEYKGSKVGVITSGVSYQYAKEVFPEDTSFLKLGLSWPFPGELAKEFASKVDKLYVVEEMDPYIERHLMQLGIACEGKSLIPRFGELNSDIVRKSIFGTENDHSELEKQAVNRPPVLCAGCPHRGFYYVLSKKKNYAAFGDIGCYTLGAAPPLSVLDTALCMGSSISTAHGAQISWERTGSDRKAIGVIGDSTFLHTGVNSLMEVAYNNSNVLTCILDNRITGMTGHQQNPGTGFTLTGEPAPEVDIEALCISIGIKAENIYVINPLDLEETSRVLDEAMAKKAPTVVITRWPCALKKFSEQDKKEFDLTKKYCAIDQDKCKKCKACVKTGCPAIQTQADGSIVIDKASCMGCRVCLQVCPFDAIEEVR